MLRIRVFKVTKEKLSENKMQGNLGDHNLITNFTAMGQKCDSMSTSIDKDGNLIITVVHTS